jgi:hypothetical protein
LPFPPSAANPAVCRILRPRSCCFWAPPRCPKSAHARPSWCPTAHVACLYHLQQRPGSNLHQLRAGVLQWLTSPGLPAGEVLEVTSDLVWTHQTTDDPRQLLGPRSSLSVRHAYTLLTRSRRTACRQAHRRFVSQALRHSAATREQVDAAVTTFVGCFGRLWRVPWENGYKEVFWRLAVNGVRAAGACQRCFSAPCPCRVVGPDT